MAITKQGATFLNIPANSIVEVSMTPRSSGETGYKSKYWPSLNGLADEAAFLSAPWGQKPEPQSDRENILLDVIGAFDLLLLQGLTAKGASTRLGLSKSRDELVRELDAETARRLSLQLPAPGKQPRNRAGSTP
jgi:hypothetical protein